MRSLTTKQEGDAIVDTEPVNTEPVNTVPLNTVPVNTAPAPVTSADSVASDRADSDRAGSRRAPRAPRISAGLRYRLVGVASVVGLLAAWQVLANVHVINPALSSSPSGVWTAARQMISDGTLGSSVASSAKLYGTGLGVSIVIGIVGGVVLGWWRLLGAIFDPWIAILYSIPLIAILPLILVWFGITFRGQVVMVVLVSVFPLLVNVMTGTRQVDPALLRLARSFRGSQLAILRTLVMPSIVPYMVTGVRLAAGGGLIGVVVAEYFEGDNGVGGLILKEGTILNTGGVFVGVTVLGGTALVMTALIRTLERWVSGWRAQD